MDLSPERLEAALADNRPADAPAHAGMKRAAVAMLLRYDDDAPELLLMKRTARDGDRWSGQISLPGGHREANDSDLVQTAVRETREEVGIDLESSSQRVGRLASLQARARGGLLPLAITPFVFRQTAAMQIALGPEAEEAFWLPLARVAAGELDSVFPYSDAQRSIDLPCWRYEGRTVWGLTHRMVSSLLGTVAGTR